MTGSLIDRLPPVRGDYASAVPMARHTWFGVGGPAEIIFSPADHDDLGDFLAGCPADIPVLTVGAGSNLLVRDGGIEGVVIRTPAHMTGVTHDGDVVTAGAGALDANVARHAARAGLAGLEFLIGIPGTVGGGLRMNAGAYGGEFRDVIIRAHGFDRSGRVFSATPDEMGMAYRHSDAPADWIFTHAEFRATTGDKAWQEIDAAGCRGLKIGDALVSEKHCNFLINRGAASAHDIESLGETVRLRVAEGGGPSLRWEIRRVGQLADGQAIPGDNHRRAEA
jgi:UDP-N-acetylmuramate dehydrogenase